MKQNKRKEKENSQQIVYSLYDVPGTVLNYMHYISSLSPHKNGNRESLSNTTS